MALQTKKTILVTGGAGFIGSNYLNTYVPRYTECTFVNFDALTYASNLSSIAVADHNNYSFVQGDIRNKQDLDQVFEAYRITDIIHFAAESHVDNSIKNPSIFIETNVLGTNVLLNFARDKNINRFVYISTDEVYGSLSKNEEPFTEESPLQPNSPYSASKAAGELLVRSFNKTYGLNTMVTRCGNNYGPNQHKEKLIPHFLFKLFNDQKVPVYGTGSNVRDWIHVQDHVSAIDLVFHKGTAGEVYNIGAHNELSNLHITQLLLQETGKDTSYIDYVADRPGHDFRYALNTHKITSELHWHPEISFEEGLRNTVSWYREYYREQSVI